MGNFLSPPARDNPVAPNDRVLECKRCKTPGLVGYPCSWCFEYPEHNKDGKVRSEATSPIPILPSVADVAAHFCQSDGCKKKDVAAVGPCSWCGKIESMRK